MTFASALGVISLMVSAPADAEENYLPTWPIDLQSHVVDMTRSFSGELGLYVEDVRTGQQYGYNSATPMYLASGIKIPVMMALYQALNEGTVNLDETLIYRTTDVRDGAPLLSNLKIGTPISLGVLLEAMIQSSDNAATDMVIRRVGIANVNRILVDEGFEGFGPITSLLAVRQLIYQRLDPRSSVLSSQDILRLRLTRPLAKRLRRLESLIGAPSGKFTKEDYERAFRQYYRQGWNSASMRGMGRLLAEIVKGEVVSKGSSQRMLAIMRGTRTGPRRFRAGIPNGISLAHKTGTQFRRTCDFGIVFLPPDERPVVIVASISGGSRGEAERLLARAAAASYSALLGSFSSTAVSARTAP
ncbi:MAG: class A beta-lactamase-related serine hydrolase [Myxococcales bacterium]|nr:class A beta-lactamase-related serine hydrolase [Myxococcales bacterium]